MKKFTIHISILIFSLILTTPISVYALEDAPATEEVPEQEEEPVVETIVSSSETTYEVSEILTSLDFNTSQTTDIEGILPQTLLIKLKDNEDVEIPVSWNVEDINEETLTYTFNTNLSEEYQYNKKVTATVILTTQNNESKSKNNSRLTLNTSEISLNMDGYFDDWNDKPYSYEYNWDNSSNCWYHGVWIDGVCYKTPEGEYSTDVRHKMQLYSDTDYIYLHIVFSKDYGSGFNGEDYQFYFNSESTKFQITDLNGKTLTNNVNKMNPGTYEVLVKHGSGSISGQSAQGAVAYINIPNDHKNIQLEFKIPYEEFSRQNSNINISNVSSIEFFTPNLMYRRIVSEGSPTGAWIIIAAAILLASLYFIKRKKDASIL